MKEEEKPAEKEDESSEEAPKKVGKRDASPARPKSAKKAKVASTTSQFRERVRKHPRRLSRPSKRQKNRW